MSYQLRLVRRYWRRLMLGPLCLAVSASASTGATDFGPMAEAPSVAAITSGSVSGSSLLVSSAPSSASAPIDRPPVDATPVDTIKVVWSEFPPFAYTRCEGERCWPAGPLVDITNAVLHELNYAVEHTSIPAKRGYHQIQTGEMDLSFHFKSRKGQFDNAFYSESPLLAVSVNAYALPDTPSIEDKQGLVGKTVITRMSYRYGGLRGFLEEANNRIRLIETSSIKAAAQALVHHRAPYLIEYHVSQALISQLIPDQDLQRMTLVPEIPLYWLMSKSRPGAAKLLAQMEDTYRRLADEGSLPALEFRRLTRVQ